MESKQAELASVRSTDEETAWTLVKGLLCQLSVQVNIPHFTVRMLLDLAPGDILDTHYEEASHLPVIVNGQMIAWGEFDVVDETLAVRLTELVS
jgi:flagellar motor switch/type III secretory pathway protein FliN